jgi:hypothetical protein
MSTEGNLVLVRRAVAEIWNGLDLDLADSLFARTYVNHGGLVSDLVMGPESVKFAVVLQHIAYPRVRIDEESVNAEEDLVELEWMARRGSGSGGKRRREPRCMARGTTLVLCTNNRVAESWTNWRRPASEEAIRTERRMRRCVGSGHHLDA